MASKFSCHHTRLILSLSQRLCVRSPVSMTCEINVGIILCDLQQHQEDICPSSHLTLHKLITRFYGSALSQREELRVAFHAFDKDKTGKLDVGEIKYLLKSVGVCLSRREQRALEAEFAERGEFDYEDLLTIGQVVYNDVAIERALVLALRKLAPQGAKTVPRNVLREHLLNLGMGVKLTEEQVDMFLDICCSENGKSSNQIKIATFIYRVLRE